MERPWGPAAHVAAFSSQARAIGYNIHCPPPPPLSQAKAAGGARCSKPLRAARRHDSDHWTPLPPSSRTPRSRAAGAARGGPRRRATRASMARCRCTWRHLVGARRAGDPARGLPRRGARGRRRGLLPLHRARALGTRRDRNKPAARRPECTHDDAGTLPLHIAVQTFASANCCVRSSAHPEAVRLADGEGSLPLHLALEHQAAPRGSGLGLGHTRLAKASPSRARARARARPSPQAAGIRCSSCTARGRARARSDPDGCLPLRRRAVLRIQVGAACAAQRTPRRHQGRLR